MGQHWIPSDSELDELAEMEQKDWVPKAARNPFQKGASKAVNMHGSTRSKPHPMEAVVGEVVLDLGPNMARRGWVIGWGPHKGKPSIPALMRATGLTYPNAYTLLRQPWTKTALRMDTIGRLCEAFACQPGDLLRYVPRRAPGPPGT